ncbi:MAG: hypothetical protein NZM11_08585 [Anaerolineales bacterium]|nr:hypothetical protein [Anaerolineales bacterium]
MHFPKHWAKATHSRTAPNGKTFNFTCWGWSDESAEAAQRAASARAERVTARFLSGQPLGRYGYGDRPLREEQLEVHDDEAGRTLAVITRNSYGVLVLNAARAMFIDIDLPEAKPAGLFNVLFGGKKPTPEAEALARLQQWAARRPDHGVRVYRTAAGLRGLVTSHPIHPADVEAQQTLRTLGSDPLYIALCRAQECFRARLTPKPWRCGLANPPGSYPRETPEAERRFQVWAQRYESALSQYAVCRFIAHYGDPRLHPAIAPIVALHDRYVLATRELPLA